MSESKKNDSNVVALIRSTRKGQRLVVDGQPVGGKGHNGSRFHKIRHASAGSQWPLQIYCDCPAQQFQAGFGRPCKHILQLFERAPQMADAGEQFGLDVVVYDAAAVERQRLIQLAGQQDLDEAAGF